MTQAPTANPRYSQETSQSEKSALLKEQAARLQELRHLNTRAALTQVLDPAPSGRWAKPIQKTGQDPTTLYPAQPPDSPWHHDPVPPENSLGYSVEDMEPVGQPGEIERVASPEPAATSRQATADFSSPVSAVNSPPSTHAEVSCRKKETNRVERAAEGGASSSEVFQKRRLV
jgi:hypothetical protein